MTFSATGKMRENTLPLPEFSSSPEGTRSAPLREPATFLRVKRCPVKEVMWFQHEACPHDEGHTMPRSVDHLAVLIARMMVHRASVPDHYICIGHRSRRSDIGDQVFRLHLARVIARDPEIIFGEILLMLR